MRYVTIVLAVLAALLARPAAAEEMWETLGRVPFAPSSMAADGMNLYVASASAGRLVRLPMKDGALGAPQEIKWPAKPGQPATIALGDGGLYAVVVEGGRTIEYRTERYLGGQASDNWQQIAELDGGPGWLFAAGVSRRMWLLRSLTGLRLDWQHTPVAWMTNHPSMQEPLELGPARNGAAVVAAPHYLYVLGGRERPTEVLAVPLGDREPRAPKKLAPLPEPRVGGVGAMHGSMLYLISAQGERVVVDRGHTFYSTGEIRYWSRLVGPPPGAAPTAAAAIQGRIVVARADGTLTALPVWKASPGRKRVEWEHDSGIRRIGPGQTKVERIPWRYEGPEEVTGFDAWIYGTRQSARLRGGQASLEGTRIEAGGGDGRTLELVVTLPADANQRDYLVMVALKSGGRQIGPILRLRYYNEDWQAGTAIATTRPTQPKASATEPKSGVSQPKATPTPARTSRSGAAVGSGTASPARASSAESVAERRSAWWRRMLSSYRRTASYR